MGTIPKEPTRRYTEVRTPEKARCRALFFDARWSKKRLAKKFRIDRSTVRRILFQGDDRRTGKNRSGRPKLLKPEDVDRLVAAATQNGWKGRTLPWDELAKQCNLQVRTLTYF